jgi:hypothetical protein
VLSALVFVAAWSSVSAEKGRPFSSQSHAYSGLFRLFPYESTALAIEDREDRYFSDEFVRFVDRNASVSDRGFHLEAEGAPAELLLATARPSGVLRFVVVADSPQASVTYRDWRGEQRFELGQNPAGARGVVEIVAGPAWRRHPFWWTDETLRAHSFRLELDAEARSRAQFRYLGPYRLVSKFFGHEVLETVVPETATAGGSDRVVARLRNVGRRPWASEADVPVHMGLTITALGSDNRPPRTSFGELSGAIERGQELLFEATVDWPREPGLYSMELDLVLAGTAWFQDWMGEPVARREVAVVAPSER